MNVPETLIFSDFCLWLLKLKSLDYTYYVEHDSSGPPPKASDCSGLCWAVQSCETLCGGCVLGCPAM